MPWSLSPQTISIHLPFSLIFLFLLLQIILLSSETSSCSQKKKKRGGKCHSWSTATLDLLKDLATHTLTLAHFLTSQPGLCHHHTQTALTNHQTPPRLPTQRDPLRSLCSLTHPRHLIRLATPSSLKYPLSWLWSKHSWFPPAPLPLQPLPFPHPLPDLWCF